MERSYRAVKAEVDDDGPGVDVYTLQGYEDRLGVMKQNCEKSMEIKIYFPWMTRTI